MILKKNLIDNFNQQNKVTEQKFESVQINVIEDSSTYDNQISIIKNILKISTPSARAFTVFTYSPF